MITRATVILVGCLAIVSSLEAASSGSLLSHWTNFKAQYGRRYESPAEEAKRFEIFAENKLKIDRFNSQEAEKSGYRLSVNHFADQTQEEMRGSENHKLAALERFPGAESVDGEFLAKLLAADSEPLPTEVDWRKVGRVTPVKNGKRCQADWAFTTAALLEGQLKPRQNISEAFELSAQQLVDCSGWMDCNYGRLDTALEATVNQTGLMSETDYPYQFKPVQPECKLVESRVVIRPKGFSILPHNDEATLQKVVAKYGPVAVSIDATYFSFYWYGGGVYQDPECSKEIYRTVLVVGYGTDPKDGDYWIIVSISNSYLVCNQSSTKLQRLFSTAEQKNSWGTGWGEDGYMRMQRGTNMCLIGWKPIIATF